MAARRVLNHPGQREGLTSPAAHPLTNFESADENSGKTLSFVDHPAPFLSPYPSPAFAGAPETKHLHFVGKTLSNLCLLSHLGEDLPSLDSNPDFGPTVPLPYHLQILFPCLFGFGSENRGWSMEQTAIAVEPPANFATGGHNPFAAENLGVPA